MTDDIYTFIAELVDYAIDSSLASEYDRVFLTNRILEALNIFEYTTPKEKKGKHTLEEILKYINDFAFDNGIIPENTVTYRDLFDTKIMGLLTPPPSVIIEKFEKLREVCPRDATDYFYNLCCANDYIRAYRVSRDVRYKYRCEYGDIDITINLSKPEKTPEEIAAARDSVKSGYPLCLLCRENEGYSGTISHPARQNHRLIPLTLNHKSWFMQYSPYVYYNEHCIVLSAEHIPMSVSRSTFENMLDFVDYLPHYFIGSNADLPIVGGSILSHDHMQGGKYTFAMEKAPYETEIRFQGYENIKSGIIRWPMSVIRLEASDRNKIAELAERILDAWRKYTDESSFIYAETYGEPHNTITPIARRKENCYELDLVLRNNITTYEHPLGVYHPHAEHHNIKKENIGLIEVMGLAVLPARLKTEMGMLADFAVRGISPQAEPSLQKHSQWFNAFSEGYQFNEDNVLDILYDEIGKTFVRVLEDCGVYKRTDSGKKAFIKFINTVDGYET